MSGDKKDKDEKPAKGKGKSKTLIMIVVGVLVMVGGGVGTAFALVKMGVVGGKVEVKHELDLPKLIKKGEEDPYAPKSAEGGHGEEGGGHEVEGEGGSEFKTSYFTFTDEFTSNLKESSALVQTSIACSTRRDGRVLMWLKKHELAIRSALLVTLADTPEGEVQTAEGKERLQKRMTAAINKVLTAEEGFGGVDEVYFRSFIVQ